MTWQAVITAAPWTVVGGLLLWFLRDRRRQRAADEVAERTVDADVEVKEIGADDARLLHLTKVWDTQKAGYEDALRQRDALIAWQREQMEARDQLIAARDQIIGVLRQRLDEAESRLVDAARELTAARDQLARTTTELVACRRALDQFEREETP